MQSYKNNNYQTWYDKKNKKLVHWSNYDRKLRAFCNGKNDNYIRIGCLSSNQNPFILDDKGVYRELYNKKVYYFVFKNNILIEK